MSVLRRNLASLLLSQLATWGMTFVTIAVVPSFLGDADFGALSFAYAFVAPFGLIAGLGTSTLMTRDVARDPTVLGGLVYNALLLKVPLVIGLSSLALVIARLIGTSGSTLVLVVIGCAAMYSIAAAEVLHSALVGLEQIARPAAWSVVQVYAGGIASLLVLTLGGNVVAYFTVLTGAQLIYTAALAVMIRPHLGAARRLDFGLWRYLVRAGVPLMVLLLLNMVQGTIDVPILRYFSGDEAVGWYSLALRWAGLPAFIATAVTAAFYPSLSALARTDPAAFAEKLNRALLIVIATSVPAAAGLGVIADALFALYPDDFRKSAVLLQILAAEIPIAAVDTTLGMALIAADGQRSFIRLAAIAAFLNPVACIVLIPIADRSFDNGAIGAAILTLGTEMVMMAGLLATRSNGVLDRHTTARAMRFVAAGAVMAGVVLLVPSAPLFVKVAIGAMVYPAMTIVLRAVSIGDVRAGLTQVRAAIRRRRDTSDATANVGGSDAFKG